MRRIMLLLLLGLATIPACRRSVPAPAPTVAPKTAPDAAVDNLLGLMRSRLVLMHDVARRKWADRAAIEDPDREAALLRNVAEQGSALGLDPAATRAFFAAQIEAAKIMQHADFRRWEADRRGPDPDAPDLARVLRPRIDALNRDLLAAMAGALPRLRGDAGTAAGLRARAGEILADDGIDDAVRAAAIQPLMNAGG